VTRVLADNDFGCVFLAHGVSRGDELRQQNSPAPEGRHKVFNRTVTMSHSYTKLLYHCVFATKERQQFLKPDLCRRIYGYIKGVVAQCNGRVLAIGGTADHAHMLLELPGQISIAEAMRLVKTNSSKWIHETFPTHTSFAWQTGYAAFTVSLSAVDDVVRYIENQDRHHRTRSFDDEFREFLRRHGVELVESVQQD